MCGSKIWAAQSNPKRMAVGTCSSASTDRSRPKTRRGFRGWDADQTLKIIVNCHSEARNLLYKIPVLLQIRVPSAQSASDFFLRRGRHRSAGGLLNEALHHGCPHHLFADGAFFGSASLREHREQCPHLQYANDRVLSRRNFVSFQEAFLHFRSDGAIAEGIFLQCFHGGEEGRCIVE